MTAPHIPSPDAPASEIISFLEKIVASGARPTKANDAPPMPERCDPQVQIDRSTIEIDSDGLTPEERWPGRELDASGDPLPMPYENCKAIRPDGWPCRNFPMHGNDFCNAHDPERAAARKDSSVRAIAARRAKRALLAREFDFALHNLPIRDRHDLQVALDAVFRLQLAGRLSNARAAAILRTLSIMARNLTANGLPDLDPAYFLDDAKTIDKLLVAALKAADRNDEDREVQRLRIDAIGRSQLAADIDRWPALDRRPAASRKLDHFPTSAGEYAERYGA